MTGNGRKKGGPHTDTDELGAVREANDLRKRGLDWDVIAGMTGYPSAGAARMAVDAWKRQAANELSIDERREALRESIEAYNFLIDKWWDTALDDYYALDRILKIMAQRDRIQGLDRTKEDTGTGSVLVIGGDEESYLAGLERVINDPN